MQVVELLILSGCTLFPDRINVQVPQGFVGWCYIVSVPDSSVRQSAFINGCFQADSNGVIAIPRKIYSVKKSYVVKTYESGIDISRSRRYFGSVYSTTSGDSTTRNYIQFYLPSKPEREIPEDSEYWIDKLSEYGRANRLEIDSLVNLGIVVF